MGHFCKKLKKYYFGRLLVIFLQITVSGFGGSQKYYQIQAQRPQISQNRYPHCHSSEVLSKVLSGTCPKRPGPIFSIKFEFLDPKLV